MRIAQHKRSIAILHCDIVEFSRLTAQNEDSTFYAVRNAFLQANDFVSNAHGEIINTAGDSFLAIFPTAQGAILASQNIQRYLDSKLLRWAGHVARMPKERLPRKFLTSWIGDTPRPLGHPTTSWTTNLVSALTRK